MECIRCDHYEEGVIKYCALLGQKLDYPREECDLLDDEANYNPDSEILANLINPGRNKKMEKETSFYLKERYNSLLEFNKLHATDYETLAELQKNIGNKVLIKLDFSKWEDD